MDQPFDLARRGLDEAAPRSIRWLNFLIGIALGALAVALTHSAHGNLKGAQGDLLLLFAAAIASQFVQVFVHEFGHLIAALLLRLPVSSLTIGGGRLVRWRWGRTTFAFGLRGRNFVSYSPHVKGRKAPLRSAVVIFAGPLANLVVGAVAFLVSRGHGIGPLAKASLLMFASVGALFFLFNLTPVGGRATRRTDGKKLLDWTLRLGGADVNRAWQLSRLAQIQDELRAGRTPNLLELRTLVRHGEGDVAPRAALLLLGADMKASSQAQFAADRQLLTQVAWREGLDPAIGGTLASGVAWLTVFWMFIDFVRTRRQMDPDALSDAAKLAELAHRRDPDAARGRYALALARCAQLRAAEARTLLVGVSTDGLTPIERVNVLAVRAIAEILLKDLAQAKRLADAARRENQASTLLDIVGKLVEAQERRQEGAAPGAAVRESASDSARGDYVAEG